MALGAPSFPRSFTLVLYPPGRVPWDARDADRPHQIREAIACCFEHRGWAEAVAYVRRPRAWVTRAAPRVVCEFLGYVGRCGRPAEFEVWA